MELWSGRETAINLEGAIAAGRNLPSNDEVLTEKDGERQQLGKKQRASVRILPNGSAVFPLAKTRPRHASRLVGWPA